MAAVLLIGPGRRRRDQEYTANSGGEREVARKGQNNPKEIANEGDKKKGGPELR
jgi:hypothetical protein